MAAERARHVDNLLSDPRKALLSMSLPLLIAILVENLQTFIDGMWCSGLGTAALSAISISSCIYSMIVAIGTGIAVGASAAIARHIGANEIDSAEKVIPTTFLIILVLSIATSAILYLVAEPIVSFVGQGENVDLCMEYVRPFLFCSFFLMMNSVWVGILRGEGASLICMGMSVIASMINIILDPVLIYGMDLGVTGASVATCISYIAVTVVGSLYYLSGRTYLKLRFRGFRPDRRTTRDVLVVGGPCALEMFVAPLLTIPQNAIVFSCGGSGGMVAYTYAFRFIDLALIPANVISKSLIPIISADIGQRSPERVVESCRITYRVTLKIGFFFMISILLSAGWLVELFMNSESMLDVRDEMVLALRIFTLTCVFHTFRLVGTAILQATEHAVQASILTLIREFVFLGTFYIAGFYSMEAIFWACDITNFVMMIVISAFAYSALRKLVREMGGEDVRLFHNAEKNRWPLQDPPRGSQEPLEG